ncbi:MAG: hypothetical protein AB8V12_03700 [Francisella endosymbiont of Hyalomma asiaticum]
MTWAKENSIQLVITEQTCKYILKHPNKIQVTQYAVIKVITKAMDKLACYNTKTSRLQKLPTQLKQLILEEND